ncbi:MAG: ABC transporter ATP-binding protein [Acidilobus sp.]
MHCVTLNSVSYEVKGRKIVDEASVDLCSGLNLILGPNGAGKTTLLRLISGIIRPTKGKVSIDGISPEKLRTRLTYIPPQITVDPLTRVIDIGDALNYGKRSGWRASLRRYLVLLDIEWAEERRLATLSSGEQRLATIAAALSREADVIIADEPTAFLDLGNQVKVFSLFQKLGREGRLVITATHDIHFTNLANEVVLLREGKTAYVGPPKRLDDSLLSKVYGVRVTMTNSWAATLNA